MTKPFCIMFDAHTFDTGWQGTTTYLAGVLNSLPEAVAKVAPDLELKIICAAEREEPIRSTVNVDFDFLPIRGGFLARNLTDIPKTARAAQADLVVSQYVRPFRSACPTMSVIHDVLFLDYPQSFSWYYRMTRRILFGLSARHSTYVATVSRYSADRIAAHFGVSADEVLITPNAVDESFTTATLSPGVSQNDATPIRMLSVSRLEKRKRHEWGIYALEQLSKAKIAAQYQIIGGGSGPYAEELYAQVSAARARGLDVKLSSGMPFKMLVHTFATADLFLCPSEAEGFGIPVIEAAAAGVPCVVSDGGALGELDGMFVGQSFDAQSKRAFVGAVERVVADLNNKKHAAQANRVVVGQKYQWATAAEQYAAIIHQLSEVRL